VGDGDFVETFWSRSAGGQFLNALEGIGRVVPDAARIAHPDGHILKDNEAKLVLERLAFDALRSNCTLAVLTAIDNPIVSYATAVGGTAQVASVATEGLKFHFVKGRPNGSRVGFREPGEIF
jgi:hypothetical protein